MKKQYKQTFKDIQILIDEFMRQEIELKDVKNWIKTHPIFKIEKQDKDLKNIKLILKHIEKFTYNTTKNSDWIATKQKISQYLKNK